MKFFSFIAQNFQDATGKTSNVRVSAFVILLLIAFAVIVYFLIPSHPELPSEMWNGLLLALGGTLGLKIVGENKIDKNKSAETGAVKQE